jgi:hypothetical protein
MIHVRILHTAFALTTAVRVIASIENRMLPSGFICYLHFF